MSLNSDELDYHPTAAGEVVAAFEQYFQIDPAVAAKFETELQHAEAQVLRSPETWAAYLYGTLAFRLHTFPFVLVYIVHDEKDFVVAVAHTRRRPGYWRTRLDN